MHAWQNDLRFFVLVVGDTVDMIAGVVVLGMTIDDIDKTWHLGLHQVILIRLYNIVTQKSFVLIIFDK